MVRRMRCMRRMKNPDCRPENQTAGQKAIYTANDGHPNQMDRSCLRGLQSKTVHHSWDCSTQYSDGQDYMQDHSEHTACGIEATSLGLILEAI
jgi:hypothetical protein